MRKFEPVHLPPLPDRPLFPVLTSRHNYERYLGETLESVLKQTCANFEAVVFDDGSTDHSRDVIQEYMKKDSRIKLRIGKRQLSQPVHA